VKTVNIHEAKTNLSKLIAAAVNGEPFLIAKAGKPMVKVIPVEESSQEQLSRLGFMEDQLHSYSPPDNLNTFMQDEIDEMFHGEGDGQKFAGLDFPFPKPGDADQRLQRPAARQKEKK
jgi:prevent-host-death family protein